MANAIGTIVLLAWAVGLLALTIGMIREMWLSHRRGEGLFKQMREDPESPFFRPRDHRS